MLGLQPSQHGEIGDAIAHPNPFNFTSFRLGASVSFSSSNSLLPHQNSLIFEMFSLLTRVGNSAKSPCSTGGLPRPNRFWGLKIAKFPVKFPVSREFAWRQVRSALRRQGGSLVRTLIWRMSFPILRTRNCSYGPVA